MSQCVTSAGKKEEKSAGQENKPGKKIRAFRRILLTVGVVCCLVAGALFFFDVAPKSEVVNIELGDSISYDPLDYLDGMKWSVRFAKMDFSEVEADKVGDYPLHISHGFDDYEVTISVRDTTAPKVTLKGLKYVAELNAVSFAKDYVATCMDVDSDVTFSFLNTEQDDSIKKQDEESVVFTGEGVHPITLMATDSSGNYSSFYMSMIVDSPPEIHTISGDPEYYVALGQTIDFARDVYAFDDKDGDLTSAVKIKAPDYTSQEGDYTVTYTATDSNGLTAQMSGVVHSYSALKIQDLFNTDRFKAENLKVEGIINPYDAGYNIDEDIEGSIERIKPAVVHIYYYSNFATYWGSGFIVKINEDDIIVCTNQHVVKDRPTVTVCLCDGTHVTGRVVGTSVTPDVAFVRLNKADLSEELLESLKTVHINLNYYKTISSRPRFEMGMYVIYADGTEMFTRYGYIVRKSGKLGEYFENFDYPVMEVSVQLTPGVSGSAIIDAHGNLLCMAAFYWDHNGSREYYGVSLEDILDFYEKVFGERLEYY